MRLIFSVRSKVLLLACSVVLLKVRLRCLMRRSLRKLRRLLR